MDSEIKHIAAQVIKGEEGTVKKNGRHVVYDDATGLPLKSGDIIIGNPTLGYGRNLADPGQRESEARESLYGDVSECLYDLQNMFQDFHLFTKARQLAIINMRYNLGPGRFRGFVKMITAIHVKDWDTAAAECLDSKAAEQLPERYGRIAVALR